MKKSLLSLIILACIAISCQPDANKRVKNKSLKLSIKSIKSPLGKPIAFNVMDDVDSVFVKGFNFTQSGKKIKVDIPTLGPKSITVIGFLEDGTKRNGNINVEVYSGNTPIELSYTINKQIKHNPENYTQGLQFYNGSLFESTGQNGKSRVIEYSFPEMNEKQSTQLNFQYFGEGLTIYNDTIRQLTWKSGTCLLYNMQLNRIGETSIPTAEGWGLTYGSGWFYLSDGSNALFKLNHRMQAKEMLQVYFGKRKLPQLNELEYIDGYIWANVYLTDQIVKIDAQTGEVVAFVDLKALRNKVTSKNAEVLNGVAYNAESGSFIVTGKYWNLMFDISINEV